MEKKHVTECANTEFKNHLVFKICQNKNSKTFFYSTLSDADVDLIKASKMTLIKKNK